MLILLTHELYALDFYRVLIQILIIVVLYFYIIIDDAFPRIFTK